ncbi:MAG: alpha/beta hydrolase [Vicinamibacterales bacterium]
MRRRRRPLQFVVIVMGAFVAIAAGAAALSALAPAPPSTESQDWHLYYTVQHPDQFAIDWRGFYEKAEAGTSEARRALTVRLDLAYGTDPKQRLDLYLPKSGGSWPVFVFIHGGGFREGDRAQYGYVARSMAANGVATVVASYRLLPHVFPDQVEDARLMVAWVYRHGREHGLDPARIYLGGHSAGAILSGLLGVTDDWQAPLGLPVDVVKGVAPVSGPYDLRNATGFVADFLPDPTTREAASPHLRIARTPPAVVAYGAKETPYVAASRAFVEALRAKGGRATLVELDGMTHDQTALALGDASSPVARAIAGLIAR